MKEIISEKRYNKCFNGRYSLINNNALPYNDETFIGKLWDYAKKKHIKECMYLFEDNSEPLQYQNKKIKDILNDIQIKEGSYLNELCSIAEKIVREEFDLPEEVKLNLKINPKLKTNSVITENSDIVHEDYESVNKIDGEIKKRLIIDCLIDGYSTDLNSNIQDNIHHFYDIDMSLPKQYMKLGSLSNTIPFNNDINTNDFGVFGIDYPKNDGDVSINCSGDNFLTLLSTCFKAVLNLIVNNTLNTNLNTDLAILNGVKENKYDPFVSKAMWGKLNENIDYYNKKNKHLLIYEWANLNNEQFNTNIKETLLGTKKSKMIIDETFNIINKEDM